MYNAGPSATNNVNTPYEESMTKVMEAKPSPLASDCISGYETPSHGPPSVLHATFRAKDSPSCHFCRPPSTLLIWTEIYLHLDSTPSSSSASSLDITRPLLECQKQSGKVFFLRVSFGSLASRLNQRAVTQVLRISKAGSYG